jgi:F0F1-type ATP synthase assembly protein I
MPINWSHSTRINYMNDQDHKDKVVAYGKNIFLVFLITGVLAAFLGVLLGKNVSAGIFFLICFLGCIGVLLVLKSAPK